MIIKLPFWFRIDDMRRIAIVGVRHEDEPGPPKTLFRFWDLDPRGLPDYAYSAYTPIIIAEALKVLVASRI